MTESTSPPRSALTLLENAMPDTSSPETITINKAHYDQLISDSEKLAALERAGVDNWDGYDFAMDDLREVADAKDN